MNKAINKIKNKEYSFIIIKDNKIVYEDNGIGVSCIRKVINTNPDLLTNSIIVDKIIGKAACMLLLPYNIKFIYSILMSQNAVNILNEYNINYEYEELTEYIINRTNDGMCPLEQSVLNVSNLDDAKLKIEETISILMKRGCEIT